LSAGEKQALIAQDARAEKFINRISGSAEIIDGKPKYCIWINDNDLDEARAILPIQERLEQVKALRLKNTDQNVVAMAVTPHRFREMNRGLDSTIAMPAISSEARLYLPAELLPPNHIVTNRAYGIYDGELYNFAILASTLHIVWVGAVCGKLELRYSYTNTLGWNTFPLPSTGLTEKNKADLTRCAEDILLAREAHFPATIADLYNPDDMPADLREAHERNDEVLERIYIGRRFRNDTERLEKLFELYAKMAAAAGATRKRKAGQARD